MYEILRLVDILNEVYPLDFSIGVQSSKFSFPEMAFRIQAL